MNKIQENVEKLEILVKNFSKSDVCRVSKGFQKCYCKLYTEIFDSLSGMVNVMARSMKMQIEAMPYTAKQDELKKWKGRLLGNVMKLKRFVKPAVASGGDFKEIWNCISSLVEKVETTEEQNTELFNKTGLTEKDFTDLCDELDESDSDTEKSEESPTKIGLRVSKKLKK